MQTAPPTPTSAVPRRVLTLFDSTCIIVGIIIGTGIYKTAPQIAQCTPNAAAFIGIWVLGGLLSLVGALCYAELATRFPEQGGEYVYLTQAYGRPAGFVFAWSDLWIFRPGSIGAMAFVFAQYAYDLYPFCEPALAFGAYAAGAVVLLACIQLQGVSEGKWAQNLLAVSKILGLALICGVGLFASSPAEAPILQKSAGEYWGWALIPVLFTYGGWNEIGYVGAEVRRPEKNLLRALVLGTLAVTVLYVLVNGAFLRALGFSAVQKSSAVAAGVMQRSFGESGRRLIDVLICISALGAINGQLFTGSRIAYALGRDHRLFRWLGRWNARRGTPRNSLLAIAAVVLALIAAIGRSEHGFTSMLLFTSPVCWTFYFLAVLGLMILRMRESKLPRASYFRVPLYPLLPVLFCGLSLFLVYSSVRYAVENRDPIMYVALAILAVGIVGSRAGRPRERSV